MTSHVRSATPPPGRPPSPPPPTTSLANLSLATSPPSLGRPRSLMESLLIAKMERAAGTPSVLNGNLSGSLPSPLLRMDSTDSASSFASTSSLGSEVCHCDDCLLGISDLYINTPTTKKKVCTVFNAFTLKTHSKFVTLTWAILFAIVFIRLPVLL